MLSSIYEDFDFSFLTCSTCRTNENNDLYVDDEDEAEEHKEVKSNKSQSNKNNTTTNNSTIQNDSNSNNNNGSNGLTKRKSMVGILSNTLSTTKNNNNNSSTNLTNNNNNNSSVNKFTLQDVKKKLKIILIENLNDFETIGKDLPRLYPKITINGKNYLFYQQQQSLQQNNLQKNNLQQEKQEKDEELRKKENLSNLLYLFCSEILLQKNLQLKNSIIENFIEQVNLDMHQSVTTFIEKYFKHSFGPLLKCMNQEGVSQPVIYLKFKTKEKYGHEYYDGKRWTIDIQSSISPNNTNNNNNNMNHINHINHNNNQKNNNNNNNKQTMTLIHEDAKQVNEEEDDNNKEKEKGDYIQTIKVIHHRLEKFVGTNPITKIHLDLCKFSWNTIFTFIRYINKDELINNDKEKEEETDKEKVMKEEQREDENKSFLDTTTIRSNTFARVSESMIIEQEQDDQKEEEQIKEEQVKEEHVTIDKQHELVENVNQQQPVNNKEEEEEQMKEQIKKEFINKQQYKTIEELKNNLNIKFQLKSLEMKFNKLEEFNRENILLVGLNEFENESVIQYHFSSIFDEIENIYF
ncbi:hypothetical protein ABK040_007601 [Willaertia magna]